MLMLWPMLIVMLLTILIAAQLFTNALEYAGEAFHLSEGVTGSIFAAIATALPETAVPIIAMVAGTANHVVNEEISVGAILGAPLMLSTLSTFLMMLAAIKQRGLRGFLQPERGGMQRDLHFFISAFLLAALAMYTPITPVYWRGLISFILICLYILYLVCTIKASSKLVHSGHGVQTNEPMWLTKVGLEQNLFTIFIQLVLSLALLLIGAKGFIDAVENISYALHLSPLLLSLLIIPLATELPEKVNSILWIRKYKDTLAFGNITGAMVFQGTLLPALGILLTPWQPNFIVLTGVMTTLIAACWLRLNVSSKGISLIALIANGFLYFIYLIFALY